MEENGAADGACVRVRRLTRKTTDKKSPASVTNNNRYKICKSHGVDFGIHEMQFDSYDDATIWIIRNQFGRRNLSNFHRAELALVLEPLIAAKAKENQREHGNTAPGKTKSLSPKCGEVIGGIRTDEELAKLSGVSKNTIRRAKIIKEKGTPEQIEREGRGLVAPGP